MIFFFFYSCAVSITNIIDIVFYPSTKQQETVFDSILGLFFPVKLEKFDILGTALICYLIESQMQRWIPLLCLCILCRILHEFSRLLLLTGSTLQDLIQMYQVGMVPSFNL